MTIELPDGKLIFRASYYNDIQKYYHFHYNDDQISSLYELQTYSLVEVTLDEDGDYFGWFDLQENVLDPCYVHYDKMLVEICFPYSLEEYERRGIGKLVKLKVTLLAENLSIN